MRTIEQASALAEQQISEIDHNLYSSFTSIKLGNLNTTDIVELSKDKLSGPDISRVFYIPRHHELATQDRLHHAILRVDSNAIELGFYPAELAHMPSRIKHPDRIPPEKYGIWRLLLQINHYTLKNKKADVEVRLV